MTESPGFAKPNSSTQVVAKSILARSPGSPSYNTASTPQFIDNLRATFSIPLTDNMGQLGRCLAISRDVNPLSLRLIIAVASRSFAIVVAALQMASATTLGE